VERRRFDSRISALPDSNGDTAMEIEGGNLPVVDITAHDLEVQTILRMNVDGLPSLNAQSAHSSYRLDLFVSPYRCGYSTDLGAIDWLSWQWIKPRQE